MFDVGFQEIVLIAVIGLVVIGPERLPKLARTIGVYLGRLRRFVTDVRSDVERELHAEELRQSLKESAEVDDLYDLVEETKGAVSDLREQVRDEVESGRRSIEDGAASDAGAASESGPQTAAPGATPVDGPGLADEDAAAGSRSAVAAADAASDMATADPDQSAPTAPEQVDGRTGT